MQCYDKLKIHEINKTLLNNESTVEDQILREEILEKYGFKCRLASRVRPAHRWWSVEQRWGMLCTSSGGGGLGIGMGLPEVRLIPLYASEHNTSVYCTPMR